MITEQEVFEKFKENLTAILSELRTFVNTKKRQQNTVLEAVCNKSVPAQLVRYVKFTTAISLNVRDVDAGSLVEN